MITDFVPPSLQTLLQRRLSALVATLEVLEGKAIIRDPLSKSEREAERGIRLAQGTTLAVTEGHALLRLDDGSDLWLDRGATLSISVWNGGGRRAVLRRGRVLALVAPAPGRPFVLHCPGSQIAVTGTAFLADVEDGTTRVAVTHGGVRLENRSGQVHLKPGWQGITTERSVPSATRTRQAFGYHISIGASRGNSAVAAAFDSTVTYLTKGSTKPMVGKKKMGMVALAVLLFALAVISFRMQQSHERYPEPFSGVRERSGSARTGTRKETAAGALAPHPGTTPQFIRLRDDETGPVAFNAPLEANSPAGSGAPLRLPLKDGALPDRGEIDRQVQQAFSSYDALVKSGVEPQVARERMEQALRESLRKQLQFTGSSIDDVDVDLGDGERIDGSGQRVPEHLLLKFGTDGSIDD